MHLLNCVSHMQSEIEQRPFWFRRKFEKRALLFYRVFRNLSFGNLPGFLWCEAIRIPAFFIFKKGAGFQLLIISRSSLSGKGGFFRFRSKLPASEKRAPENMEVKSEGSNEFQIYENCSGIPFSYWPSRFRRKACMQHIPAGQIECRSHFCLPGGFRIPLFFHQFLTGKPQFYPGIGVNSVVDAAVVRNIAAG